jgi:Zn-dependent peptidase ImmA (M78 family)/transcriptional regulator with XRE-family HTH domain
MKDNVLPLIARIRIIRQGLGFSQEELAQKAGFGSAQIISQIEKGERDIKAYELVKLSKVLHTDLYGFFTEEIDPIPKMLWRNKIDENIQNLREKEFLNRCQEYHGLEELCDFRTPPKLPQCEVDSTSLNFSTAQSIAQQCGGQLNLGSRPAASLERLLENAYGVKIWYMDLGQKGSAACVIGPFGPGILMNKNEAPWRRNYNFAHELFHLITWKSLSPEFLTSDENIWERVERIAEVFASNLLLPADPVLSAFHEKVADAKVKYIDLVGVAREFDVSTAALLYRLLNLGQLDKKMVEKLLNDPEFKRIDTATMHQHWWEPPLIPERFVRLAFLAYKKGKCSRARLASYFGKGLRELADFLKKYDLFEEEDYQTEIAVT